MDSRKPLSNISNNVFCKTSLLEESVLSSKDTMFSLKKESSCGGESAACFHNFSINKRNQVDWNNNEDENVADYLGQLFAAQPKNDFSEGRSLNRTTDQFSWPYSVISKPKRKKSLHKRTTDGKQILYKAYERSSLLSVPDETTTWRHFI